MYIYIFEDGEFKKVAQTHEDDFESVRNRDLEIIDISDPKNPLYYTGESWDTLEEG